MSDVITSPIKAIRKYCLECCKESANEVKLCQAEGCILHPFRFGHNPYLKQSRREWTDEEREAQRQKMIAINKNKKESTDN